MDEERKPTCRRLYTVFLDTVKITDVFATHVNLNYKGQSTFKTVIGGTTTIVIFIDLLIYALCQLNDLFMMNNTSLNSVIKIQNLIYNPSSYEVGNKGMLFSLYAYSNYPSILYNSLVFEIKAFQVKTTKPSPSALRGNTTSTELKLARCGDRFVPYLGNDTSNILFLPLTLCINSTDYKVGGNLFSAEYNYVEIKFTKCKGKSYCLAESDINTIIEQVTLGVAYLDRFFDTDIIKCLFKLFD